MEDEKVEAVNFQISSDKKRQLEQLATESEHSLAWLMRKIVDGYLEGKLSIQ